MVKNKPDREIRTDGQRVAALIFALKDITINKLLPRLYQPN